MKKIGREVLFLKTSQTNPRNGEGDFIRLNDGRIMFAYTEYFGDDWEDHAVAKISALFSADNGETWGDKTTLIEKTPDQINLMCVSLLRMNNGDIGIFYLAKLLAQSGNIIIQLYLSRTSDDFKTISDPVACINEEGYFVFENARAIRLSNGRIVVPLNLHKSEGMNVEEKGTALFYISDDDGKSFYDTSCRFENPFPDDKSGLQETGVIEMENGKLFAFSRTGSGSQFESFSLDFGLTWSDPKPSMVFSSRVSPMHVRHLVNGYTIAVLNPQIALHDTKNTWGRTPLAAYVCKGEGENFWSNISFHLLEDDLTNGYCYPTVFAGEDYFLCAYYHSNNTGHCLDSCKIVKVPYDELILPR